MKETLAFIIMSMFLLRSYARHTGRRARTALVALVFVVCHLISSILSTQPLLLPAGTQTFLAERALDQSTYAAARDATLVIFYNLFVPPTSEGVETATKVIHDQMGQVSTALHRLEGPGFGGQKRGVVFYNLIGNEAGVPPEKMRDVCRQLHPRLECRQLQHYPNGTEAVTLKSMHDFCGSDIVQDANDTRVTYLHSKGSYHDHGKQTPWRRELTNSSLHPHCLYPPDRSCDVCGAQYYTMFTSMFPGNMWTAKCSYIRKLLPPVEGGEYTKRKEEAVKQFFLLRAEGVMQNTINWHQDVFYGLDRYIWEHWVGSHPSLVPCEVHSPKRSFADMVDGKVRPNDYEWGLARRDMVWDTPGRPTNYVSNNDKANFRQYYFLAGNMLKWRTLYNDVPAQGSWVWDRFPAGQKWKELAARHGTKAFGEFVQSRVSPYHSPFALNQTQAAASSTTVSDSETLSGSNPPVVAFYQITIPPYDKDKAMDAVKAQFSVLYMGPYDDATKTFPQKGKVLLYYTISGGGSHEIEFVSNQCKVKSDRITCRPLGVYNSDHASGETLSKLRSFCKAKPSSNVVYISNQLLGFRSGEKDDEYNEARLKVTTSAVLSKMCQVDGKSCNVCGAEFYPLPFLHFTGNMFSTSCGYVNKLMHPEAFESEMYSIAGDTFLAHLRTQFTTELLKFNPRVLGLKQHSVEHWIGGHPDFKPCDVAPVSGEKPDEPLLDRMKRYSRAIAPRRESAPPGYLDLAKESKFRLKREAAFREYYYLAGNVFRWHRLYRKGPSSSSWVWQWFPDGDAWEAASRKSGADAVKKIAKQLDTDIGMEQFWVE